MLNLPVKEKSVFIEDANEFYTVRQTTLCLEHSLLSLKKWESHWKIPFLLKQEKTAEQMVDYFKCMTLSKNVDPMVYQTLSQAESDKIVTYIQDPMCATKFNDNLIGAQRHSNEVVTAETIYYWMIMLNIPVECQKWHLNQLLALIKLTNLKNDPKKKHTLSQREQIMKYADMNEKNKKFFEDLRKAEEEKG